MLIYFDFANSQFVFCSFTCSEVACLSVGVNVTAEILHVEKSIFCNWWLLQPRIRTICKSRRLQPNNKNNLQIKVVATWQSWIICKARQLRLSNSEWFATDGFCNMNCRLFCNRWPYHPILRIFLDGAKIWAIFLSRVSSYWHFFNSAHLLCCHPLYCFIRVFPGGPLMKNGLSHLPPPPPLRLSTGDDATKVSDNASFSGPEPTNRQLLYSSSRYMSN